MKITWKEAAYILNKKNTRGMFCFDWSIEKRESDTFALISKMKMIYKIILFPIGIIMSFFYCLFDGGLKDFFDTATHCLDNPSPTYGYSCDKKYDSIYSRMLEIIIKNS